jgi:hypothetical protein
MVHYFGLRCTALLVAALLAGAVLDGVLTGHLVQAAPADVAPRTRGD